jgi:Hemerythrin HHE cation binding domain
MAGIAVAEATDGNPVPHPNRDDLRWELERIRKAARAVPGLSFEERQSVVDPIVTVMHERFLPRADAEEAAIYPKLGRAFSRDVTTLLLFHHRLIERQAAELAAADPREGARLQELLYGLHGLIESHLARERELYLQLLVLGRAASSAPEEEAAAA